MLIKTQLKELLKRPGFLYIVTQFLLAISLLNSWWIWGVLLCGAAWYLLSLYVHNKSQKTVVYILSISNFLFMTTILWWFQNIHTAEWFGKLWLLSASQWLLVGVISIAAISTAIQLPLTIGVYRGMSRWKTPLLSIYIYALYSTFTIVMTSIVMSVFFKASYTPIAPSWNFHNLGLFISDSPLRLLTSVFGLWGSSFMFVMFSAFIVHLATMLYYRKFTQVAKFGVCIFFLVCASYGIAYSLQPKTNQAMDIIVSNQPESNPEFLAELQRKLNDIPPPTSPILVVLPEYSGLQLSPIIAGDSPNIQQFSTLALASSIAHKSIYIATTESEFYNNSRYAESFIINNELKKIKRIQKEFLVPGGEYIFWWGDTLLRKFDPVSTIDFVSKRSHRVLASIPDIQTDDSFSQTVAIGACSAILAPYMFQDQIKNGAEIIAINSSFEQFSGAQEYEQYSNRYARFLSASTGKPTILAVRAGYSIIIDHTGKLITKSTEQFYETTALPTKGTTLYTKLGDTIILFLATLPLLLISIRLTIKKYKT